jgi:hypothetical protein
MFPHDTAAPQQAVHAHQAPLKRPLPNASLALSGNRYLLRAAGERT